MKLFTITRTSDLALNPPVRPRAMAASSLVLVSPRPRDSPFPSSSFAKVHVSLSTLEPLFHLPQESAARRLGVSLTSLKAACRKIGIKRWPYRRWPEAGLEDDLGAPAPSLTAASSNNTLVMEAAVPSPPVPDETTTTESTHDGWLASVNELGEDQEWLSWYMDCDASDVS
ncbi:hypothetical protein GUITHDRAFT_116813 [Guillardia theta CCMP2712]|uniref:RWP-RK domain-containing protein n=1 Tax=Guillardia theta (strain CCMP2712) TaxID=905079 RepID=L1IL27_GUITC|nr:hypothetical protein GUITHDRAFT_116813 [Guillardia theta CCMP2712]EKX36946.1 hypothetical protein GUITHDRAFT_116813 [Guillardia theta CCMP2712]|eukprot:XP_005823926.1 hypothetical protein GUITHDRAFT_116813 [Guillardia theta CCMP2712]